MPILDGPGFHRLRSVAIGSGVALAIFCTPAAAVAAPISVGVSMTNAPDSAAPVQAYTALAGRAPAIVMWFQAKTARSTIRTRWPPSKRPAPYL